MYIQVQRAVNITLPSLDSAPILMQTQTCISHTHVSPYWKTHTTDTLQHTTTHWNALQHTATTYLSYTRLCILKLHTLQTQLYKHTAAHCTLKLEDSLAKEPYTRDYILQKRPMISTNRSHNSTNTLQQTAVDMEWLQLVEIIGLFCRI